MAAQKISFTKLAHDVVYESGEPLSVVEIIERVNAITPITTKNPKQTIRNAVSQSQMIVSNGDGRYGWKPRLVDGSIVRHTLSEAELVKKVLHWDQDLRDAIWPTFYAKQMYEDRSPAKVGLLNEVVVELPLIHFGNGVWGTEPPPPFWEWLNKQNAQVGDHLLFHVIDNEARWFAVTFEARKNRDEQAIQKRNQALFSFMEKMKQRPQGAAEWDVTRDLLATGFYYDDIPPDPFSEMWETPTWAGRLYAEDDEPLNRPEDAPDPLLTALFERPAQVYDPDLPPNLPREYDPDYGRRHSRRSQKARKGSVTAYTLRINHRAFPDAYGELLLAEDQTLEDLHLEIQILFHWDDDHLYSFYVTDPDGRRIEIGSPWSETTLHTHLIQLGALNLTAGQRFLYLFDYGDNHEFDVQVMEVNPYAPKGKYPKVLTYLGGKGPKQYPGYDDDNW